MTVGSTFWLTFWRSSHQSISCRFLVTALELLGKLVETFGPIIHATRTSAPSIGVDLQAEQRYGSGCL
jgi:hypothetical protein